MSIPAEGIPVERRAGDGSHEFPPRWLPAVTLLMAVVWVLGLGSAVAVGISVWALRRWSWSEGQRRLLQIALVVGVAGVTLTVLSFLLLSGAETNALP